MKRKLAAVFVLVARQDAQKVIAYYSLSDREIRLDQLPLEIAKKAGKYNRVPVTLLARMAVDRAHKGKRLGELVLLDALHRSLRASELVASFAVLVDAKDEDAAGFYRKYGFLELPEDSLKLFLPMQTIQQLPGF